MCVCGQGIYTPMRHPVLIVVLMCFACVIVQEPSRWMWPLDKKLVSAMHVRIKSNAEARVTRARKVMEDFKDNCQ